MNTRTSAPSMRCQMTERRTRDYYDELKSLFLKEDSDWTDKAKSVRTIANKFYVEITGAEIDCTYASAIGRFYRSNNEQCKKAIALKDELNDIIHSNRIISRKEYLNIYNSIVQQISFATKVYPDKKTMDLICKHHKESATERESRFRECINAAITNKQKVKLYGYSSSHSDSKENRTIEPIELICDGRSIWAYEEKQDGTGALRQFKLGRTDNVKVLEEAWSHEACHSKAFVDPFEWAMPTTPTIHITILVGPSAKNHLVEMCPESKKRLTPNGDGQWLLDDDVHDLTPVKKFCQDFKTSISVYVPDELKEALGLKEPSPINNPVEAKNESLEVPTKKEASKNLLIQKSSTYGFKGMLKKIMRAIHEYLQEWKSQSAKNESKINEVGGESSIATFSIS